MQISYVRSLGKRSVGPSLCHYSLCRGAGRKPPVLNCRSLAPAAYNAAVFPRPHSARPHHTLQQHRPVPSAGGLPLPADLPREGNTECQSGPGLVFCSVDSRLCWSSISLNLVTFRCRSRGIVSTPARKRTNNLHSSAQPERQASNSQSKYLSK